MKTVAVLVITCFALASCGGNDDSSSASTPPVAVARPVAIGGTISGTALKGPINGATVCAYKIDNAAANKRGALILATGPAGVTILAGCAVTPADGSYALILPVGTIGDVLLETSGGTYCSNEAQYDKASLRCLGTGGAALALNLNALRAVVTAPASGVVVPGMLTPFGTAAIANAIAAGNLSTVTFQSQFAALIAALGLPNGLTVTTAANDATLQALLAALSRAFGIDANALAQAFADFAKGKYKYANGVFTPPPVPTALPAIDVSQCPRINEVPGSKVTGRCTAGAVGDFITTALHTKAGAQCRLTIAKGVFTLTDGTNTVTALMDGLTDGGVDDYLLFIGTALSGINASTTRADNGDQSTVSLEIKNGVLTAADAVVNQKSGATFVECVSN